MDEGELVTLDRKQVCFEVQAPLPKSFDLQGAMLTVGELSLGRKVLRKDQLTGLDDLRQLFAGVFFFPRQKDTGQCYFLQGKLASAGIHSNESASNVIEFRWYSDPLHIIPPQKPCS